MRLAFEIILAIPALLFAAALIVGARHRRKLKEGTLFTGANRENRDQTDPTPLSPLPPVQSPRLSESDFESALVHVEQLRAQGKHAEADAALRSLHGQAPPESGSGGPPFPQQDQRRDPPAPP